MATDVAGSGGRDDQLQLRMRRDLREIIEGVLEKQSLAPDAIDFDDLGDGLRIVASPNVSPNVLLDPFIPNLATALREHQKLASDAARLRLRVAVHTGLLHRDPGGGRAGGPLVLTARLLDSEPVRAALRDNPCARMALIVSQVVYDDVVRHGYGLDPDSYRPVTIAEKEVRVNAWLHVPDGERCRDGSVRADAPPAGSARSAQPGSAVHVTGDSPIIGNIAGRDSYGRL